MFSINVEGDVKHNRFEINSRSIGKMSFFKELVSSLLKIQGRKHALKTENTKNDALADSLRDKGFYIADQSRHGRSGSAKESDYRSGELDITVRNAKGNIISVIEALELGSLGEKDKTVSNHIYKLLNRYDTAGNKENFIIVYSKAKYFGEIWKKYKTHVNQKIFPKDSNLEELPQEKSEIKAGRNLYKKSNKKLKLYHLFVNMYIKG